MSEQMTLYDIGLEKSWQYDEDTGEMMCRCPTCGGRLTIGEYIYWNPYHYCPYCGLKLREGEFTKRYVQIYGRKEEVERVREEYRVVRTWMD